MQALFEYLKEINLIPNRIEKEIEKWDASRIITFIDKCAELIPERGEKVSSIFSFISNSHMGCNEFGCRIKSIDQLARFAALYADTVLIPNFFSSNDLKQIDYITKLSIINNLKLLYYIKPLLDSGLMGFARSKVHFCKDCYEKYLKDQKMGLFDNKIIKFKQLLKIKYLKETRFFVGKEHGLYFIKNIGPEELVEHSELYTLLRSLPSSLHNYNTLLKDHESITIELKEKDIIESNILDNHISPIVNDMITQNWYSQLYGGANYLTNRTIDLDIISYINEPNTNIFNEAIIDSFHHSVPFIENIQISKLVKLRSSEGEAFNVYRDALSSALKISLINPNPSDLKDAFQDIVRPELNKIDLTIKNSRKILCDSVTRDIIYGAGFITIGLYSGLLPPEIGKMIAALGGFKFAHGLLEKTSKLLQESDDIRNNKFYFLWKVRKISN